MKEPHSKGRANHPDPESCATADAARKFKISAGRIWQLRKELAESWRRFVGNEPVREAA